MDFQGRCVGYIVLAIEDRQLPGTQPLETPLEHSGLQRSQYQSPLPLLALTFPSLFTAALDPHLRSSQSMLALARKGSFHFWHCVHFGLRLRSPWVANCRRTETGYQGGLKML